MPLHFTAFHPDYKMTDMPPTPPETLRRARAIARAAGLRYVYIGNVHDEEGRRRFARAAARPLIGRDWYAITHYALKDGACAHCGHPLPGRFGTEPVALRSGFRRLRVSVADLANRRAHRDDASGRDEAAARHLPAVRGRDVGALLLLRDARTAGALPRGRAARRDGLGSQAAQRLYGWYGFFAYVLPVLGGAAADRWLGTRRAIMIGGLIIAAGHFCLATPIAGTFFAGLVLVVVGTGFFKANVSTMVGQLYRERDPRRDPGFTIYYMGVNTGALLGPLVCGYLAASPHWGWHYGFGAAGVGMVCGLVCYRGAQKSLPARHRPGAHPDRIRGGREGRAGAADARGARPHHRAARDLLLRRSSSGRGSSRPGRR